MKKLQFIVVMGATLSVLAALAGASAQAPPSSKPIAAQRLPAGVHRLSGAAADKVVLVSTGKTGVDKAAVRAREEKDAASDQAVSDGEAFFKAGNTQLAVDAYKIALDISPSNGLAYWRLAEAYTATGKLEDASRAFRKFLVEGFGPGAGNGGVGDTANEWAEYALVLVKTGQPAEAVQAYNHAAYLLDYEVAGPEKGQSKMKVLLPEVVMSDALPNQVPYTPEHLQALADILLAHTQSGFWSYKQIKAHASEAAKLYPDSAPVQYYLGEALSGSRYAVLDSPVKDKAAAQAAYEEDKKGQAAAYQKAAALGDETTAAAAKEQSKLLR